MSEKVQVGKDQENAQSEKGSHSNYYLTCRECHDKEL